MYYFMGALTAFFIFLLMAIFSPLSTKNIVDSVNQSAWSATNKQRDVVPPPTATPTVTPHA